MTSDDKKIKTDPANKNDVPSKDKSTAVDTSKAEGGKIADAVPYSRGERQKPISQAYRDNWNAIFAKKKKRLFGSSFASTDVLPLRQIDAFLLSAAKRSFGPSTMW